MNPCKWSEQLDDYLDGALSSVEECALEEHLLSCTECRQIYENAEALKALLSATAKPERLPDNAFFEKALAEAHLEFKPVRGRSLFEILRDMMRSHAAAFRLAQAVSFVLVGFLVSVLIRPSSRDLGQDSTRFAASPEEHVPAVFPSPTKPGIVTESAALHTKGAEIRSAESPANSQVIDKGLRGPLMRSAIKDMEKALSSLDFKPSLPQITLPSEAAPRPTSGESRLLAVASRERQFEVLESLQRMKLQIYMAGDNRFIPEVHKIESFIADIANVTESSDQPWLDNLKIFQEAEQCLVEKKYVCAIQNYSAVSEDNPGSLMSFLAQYQTANVCFEEIKDYEAALKHYQKCLENYPTHYISDEKKEIILKRIDLLTRNAMNNWEPLRLYLSAREASPQDALTQLRRIITEYPTCTLVREAAQDITVRITTDARLDSTHAEEIIVFFRECGEQFQARDLRQVFQYCAAEIFHKSLRNYPQALLEYTRTLEMDTQSGIADKSRENIRLLYDYGVRYQ